MFKNLCFTLVFLTVLSSPALSKVQLPAVLSSNMVLQQQSKARLWGTARKSAKVTVITSWDKRAYTANSNADGNWEITVPTPSAGGPFQISFDDGEKTLLENILIGDVWVCSGQSNMGMRVRGGVNQPISNLHDIVLESNNPQVRVFTVANVTSPQPLNDVKGQWKLSNPENAMDFSAVAFLYAQNLQKFLKVPVGVIVTAWGGTPIRSWMSEASLKDFPEIPLTLSEKANPKDARVLYNAMIAPLTPLAIKGFLWYQGEADRNAPDTYERQMQAMVRAWRDAWKLGDLPFYYVQIAPWLYPGDHALAGALLREQQLKASKSVPNSGMAVAMDLGSDQTIHPPNKTDVAKRLAYLALSNTYGIKGIPSASPEFKELKIAGKEASLTFTNSEQGLYFKNKTSDNFEIAGADKVFHPAQASINNKGIVVKSDAVSNPVAVRYAFKNYVEGDLYNTYGLPASSFRTDDWKVQ